MHGELRATHIAASPRGDAEVVSACGALRDLIELRGGGGVPALGKEIAAFDKRGLP